MLTIHHLGLSQSERIIWLCEELAISYELKRYDRDAETGEAPPDYRALHPMRLAPVITDDGMILAESAAIIEFILAMHDDRSLSVRRGQTNFTDYLFWFHFANGTMMPSEQSVVIATLLQTTGSNKVVDLLIRRSDRMFALVEHRLGEVPFFAGQEFSAADIMMLFPLTTLRKLALLRGFRQRDLNELPHIRSYLQRIGKRPAYQRAMAKGDPGDPPLLI